jgi:MFS family permease
MTVRTGERFATVAGAASVLVSMVLFATLGVTPGLALILLALALSGLGMGIALPATSATMASEVHANEYGVMSAAQLMATQVGEVAGIQVVLTLQESLAHRAGLENVGHSPALLHSFQVAFWVGALMAGAGLVCAFFTRTVRRGVEEKGVTHVVPA